MERSASEQQAVLLPSCSTTLRRTLQLSQIPKVLVFTLWPCSQNPWVLWLQLALDFSGILCTTQCPGSGKPCLLMALTIFYILQENAAPCCWIPGESYKTQRHGWRLLKITIWSMRLSCLCCLEFPQFFNSCRCKYNQRTLLLREVLLGSLLQKVWFHPESTGWVSPSPVALPENAVIACLALYVVTWWVRNQFPTAKFAGALQASLFSCDLHCVLVPQ